MNPLDFSHEQLLRVARLSSEDMAEINQRRRPHNRLGFAYQIAFVRLNNRFPTQQTFEVEDEILTFVSVQLDIPSHLIQSYAQRQPTLSEHQDRICAYLKLRRFGDSEKDALKQYLFEEACRLEQAGPLLLKAKEFLKEQGILQPADDTLQRLIATQREQARQHIFERITGDLSSEVKENLDALLTATAGRFTPLQNLKQPPGQSSPATMLRLISKLEQVQATGVLAVDLAWLNNNYQRSLTRYVRRCSAGRLRQLQSPRRYAVLVCFLWQIYRDTIDHIVDMYDKIVTGVYTRAQTEIDEETRKQRKMLRSSLTLLRTISEVLLDETVDDAVLRDVLFSKVDREALTSQMEAIEGWLDGKYSHVFNLVVQRFSYFRQFAPALLAHLDFQLEEGTQSTLVEAIELLREMNQANKRKLPEDAPLSFIPKRLQPLVETNGTVNKHAWECALLAVLRDEIRAGNVFVEQSKRFGRFDDFFISDTHWRSRREAFFQRAGLPVKADDVPDYLTERLNQVYDQFLGQLPENTYASVGENGWQLSSDPGDKLEAEDEQRLGKLQQWLAEHLRTVKLPELLIEVDNELHFTRHFMTAAQQREADQVCLALAAVMAHGCNIGPYTMARLTEGVSYEHIKHVTNWQLTEEAQRQALAQLVNAISNLDVTQAWGEGKTSSSDGQRFRLKRKVLQRTYSHKFRDYALEFYSFVADNYAPFYSIPIECTDRDAAYVLDGLLYNESDLALEEHYTDTHGYTEINFAAFAMLGRRFAPRIRGLKHQRIYRIDPDKDYGPLSVLVGRRDRTIHLDWICDQWDRMGQFYASLESGHATASTALKRLAGYSGKNQFYRANRELGRVFKTEHILQYMSDPVVRQRVRRGLLKGEELHALARQVAYGKQGKLSVRDIQEQKNTSSCLTLIMACIIYWQAKEINRVIQECEPEKAGIDLSLLEHISPIGWDNVLLYGEYVLDRSLVQP
ncbi:MAG: Tn3 family transposase [Anaerolineae bacterium]